MLTNPLMPKEAIMQMLPIYEYEANNKIKITYSDIEKKISFYGNSDTSCYLSELSKISYNFIDLKISDINALGLNFIAKYNLKNRKLKILNKDIEKYMPDLKKILIFK